MQELDSIAIPKWKENIEIIKNQIYDLLIELINQNKKILKYSETFELFKR